MVQKKILDMNFQEYHKLLNCGMFWEWYPNATGKHFNDMLLSREGKFKIEEDDTN